MFVTIAVVMCFQVAAGPLHLDRDCAPEEMRVDEVVTDSDQNPELDSLQACFIGSQMNLADWKAKSRVYASPQWRIARVRCVPGHFDPPRRA
jgi:hypothetical protein